MKRSCRHNASESREYPLTVTPTLFISFLSTRSDPWVRFRKFGNRNRGHGPRIHHAENDVISYWYAYCRKWFIPIRLPVQDASWAILSPLQGRRVSPKGPRLETSSHRADGCYIVKLKLLLSFFLVHGTLHYTLILLEKEKVLKFSGLVQYIMVEPDFLWSWKNGFLLPSWNNMNKSQQLLVCLRGPSAGSPISDKRTAHALFLMHVDIWRMRYQACCSPKHKVLHENDITQFKIPQVVL